MIDKLTYKSRNLAGGFHIPDIHPPLCLGPRIRLSIIGKILDSERSGELSGFTMVFIFCIQNFYPKECLDFNIYSILSFSKLDQDGTLNRSFSIPSIIIKCKEYNHWKRDLCITVEANKKWILTILL